MKAFAMTLALKSGPGVVVEYTRQHRAVWPEVLQGLRGIGITKMKIYLHNRRLFMYLEAGDDFDPARDFPRYMDDPRAKGMGRADARAAGARLRRETGRVVGRDGGGLRSRLVRVGEYLP